MNPILFKRLQETNIVIIGAVKETGSREKRIPLTPASTDKLVKKGALVLVEQGIGSELNIKDSQYASADAVLASRVEVLTKSDLIVRVGKPSLEEISGIKQHAVHLSFLNPFNESELIASMAKKKISAISVEMIPRTTLAQKMDALSSQASLAGYVAVILAAERINRILPMMMTPSGTISPARVFIIGAGVAGLQAIATAKRLGARVDAFDTRPVVKEQVESLGARFVQVDLGTTGQTKDGYAQALTPEQLALQREAMAKVCAQSDIVITTAQVFGRRAPVIVTRDMLARMKPGSVVVDMAVESGGNVEGIQLDQELVSDGVRLIGLGNLPGRVALNASDMLSSNFTSFIEHFWNKEKKAFDLDLNDEIIRGCLVTHAGEIVNERLKG